MITFKQKGDFKKLTGYLERVKEKAKLSDLRKYGQEGIHALGSATPMDTMNTAYSWWYGTEESENSTSLVFGNSNINNGVQIAVILQYGHGTGTGGYVEGQDYINPAIQPIFDKIEKEVWEGVKNA